MIQYMTGVLQYPIIVIIHKLMLIPLRQDVMENCLKHVSLELVM